MTEMEKLRMENKAFRDAFQKILDAINDAVDISLAIRKELPDDKEKK